MPKSPPHQVTSDVCLLLRADAEQCWLQREVIPVLRELEKRERLVEEDAGAALAYLEAMWSEAAIRARATDAAHGELRSAADNGGHALSSAAGRYHAAVRVLRELIAIRVGALVQGAATDADRNGGTQSMLVEAPAAGGCTPRAA